MIFIIEKIKTVNGVCKNIIRKLMGKNFDKMNNKILKKTLHCFVM